MSTTSIKHPCTCGKDHQVSTTTCDGCGKEVVDPAFTISTQRYEDYEQQHACSLACLVKVYRLERRSVDDKDLRFELRVRMDHDGMDLILECLE